MAMSVKEIKEWLNTLNENDAVGVDDGGLCLQSFNDPDAYLEIGGMPDEEDEEDE